MSLLKYLLKYLLKENKCDIDTRNKWADAQRKELIKDFFDIVKNESDYNTEEPIYSELLDPYDGYEYQTYIQNKLNEQEIVLWEGFSEYCWEAFEDKYPNKKRHDIIEEFITTRGKYLGDEFGMMMSDYDYFYEEDIYGDSDYIMWIEFKKKYK